MREGRWPEYRDRIADEAAQWFVRLQDDEVSGEQRAAFAEWLSVSAEHVHEYLAVAALYADIGEAPARRGIEEIVQLAGGLHESNIIELDAAASEAAMLSAREADAGARAEGESRGAARSWRRYPALAASVAVVVLGCVWWLRGGFGATSYSTTVGEQKSVALADGSVLTLNAVSEVRIRYTAQYRDIQLRSGEALFNVAKDAQRPFRVLTEDSVIQAVGTRFNVRRRHEDTTVTVIEGRVKVAGVAPSAARASSEGKDFHSLDAWVAVAAGQRAHVDAPGVVKVSTADTAANTAWRERRLIFESRPLREVVAEFNLYNAPPIEIRDPALNDIRVSGSFYANDPRSFGLFLEEAKLAKARAAGGAVQLLPFAPPAATK